METGKGSIKCPWLLQAQAGQRVNFTLLNFDTLSTSNPDMCRVYAIVREMGESHTICLGRSRLAHVYTSTTHALEVRIIGSNPTNDVHGFSLLKYESKYYCTLERSERMENNTVAAAAYRGFRVQIVM